MKTTHPKTTTLEPGEGRILRLLGEAVEFKITASRTGGAYSMFEVSVPPGGGPHPHVRHHDDECLFVLEGVFDLFSDGFADGETTTLGPGSLAYVPRGCLRSYENVGKAAGRLLVIHTPGGVNEGFFEEIGDGAGIEKLPPVAARHGIEVPPQSRNEGERAMK